ncbi:MAG: fimbrial biogenesis chaperone [Serratia sp. (in: enterobacteria)]|uniref:fimbrial biogenesis chaperone n=1 Tax=Serratia sp. (in: enterobacteria) TaxID=616 RepID=UPI003F39DE69
MNICFKPLLLSLLFVASLAQAADVGGITVGGTRLIYDGSKKEASLNVTNSDTGPYLIQSWADTQNGGAEKAPFIVTPPLFRLDGNEQNLLRIVRTGGNLPEDRESLYWLNIKSIPTGTKKDNANTLQIAVKTRIKLIYRPLGLMKKTPEELTKNLTWSQSGSKLTVTNPTAYYMNFQQVKVGGRELKGVTFVAPMSSATFDAQGASGSVTWKLITDYGGTGAEHSPGH